MVSQIIAFAAVLSTLGSNLVAALPTPESIPKIAPDAFALEISLGFEKWYPLNAMSQSTTDDFDPTLNMVAMPASAAPGTPVTAKGVTPNEMTLYIHPETNVPYPTFTGDDTDRSFLTLPSGGGNLIAVTPTVSDFVTFNISSGEGDNSVTANWNGTATLPWFACPTTINGQPYFTLSSINSEEGCTATVLRQNFQANWLNWN